MRVVDRQDLTYVSKERSTMWLREEDSTECVRRVWFVGPVGIVVTLVFTLSWERY